MLKREDGMYGLPMKTFNFILIFFLCISSNAQLVIDNPERPLNKNTRRTVMLEEVMRIKDDGDNVVFKVPKYLSLSEDGSIFLLDFTRTSHLYKFDKNGQFVFKIMKDGQGPRECQYASNYFIQGNRIRILTWNPPKVMDFKPDGRYIKEIKTGISRYVPFLKMIDGKIYGIRDDIPHSNAINKEGYIESPYGLYEISEDFQTWRKIYDFPVKHYIKRRRWYRRVKIDFAAHGHYLYVVNTAEYKIIKFDLRHEQIDRIIKRKYRRRKSKKKVEKDLYNPVPQTTLEYYYDISQIQIYKDSLWVRTSTSMDNGTKNLIDIFDKEGKYIDSYYLQFPSNKEDHFYTPCLLSDEGFIYVPEQNRDGLVSIGKYRIKDLN